MLHFKKCSENESKYSVESYKDALKKIYGRKEKTKIIHVMSLPYKVLHKKFEDKSHQLSQKNYSILPNFRCTNVHGFCYVNHATKKCHHEICNDYAW